MRDRGEKGTFCFSHAVGAGGSFSDGAISVGFSLDFDIGFGDFKDELLIVEDGTPTTHDVLETNSTDVAYTHGLSLSAPDYSRSSTASGGNRTFNRITTDLDTQTLEDGLNETWSSYSSTTTTPAGTTTTSLSSLEKSIYGFSRLLNPTSGQEGWQQDHYEHRSVNDEYITYADGSVWEYGWDFLDPYDFSGDPSALMFPGLTIGGPAMYPTGGQWSPAWAADQPGPTGTVYQDSGPMPDGGYWEHYDDGYQWWYTEFDAAGNVTFHESGVHAKSGGQGFQEARNTVTEGQEEAAPLNNLQGDRADTVAEPTGDTDQDQTPDHLDEDMDGDGDPNVSDEDDDGDAVPDWQDEQEAQRKREKAAELTGRYQTIYNLASRVRKYRAEGNDAMAEAFQKDLNSHLNVVRDLEEELGRLPGAGDRIAYRTINGMGDEALEWDLVEKIIHAIQYAYDEGMFEDEVKERVETLLSIAEDPAALAQFAVTFLGMKFLMNLVKRAGLCGPAGAALATGQAATYGIRIHSLMNELGSATFTSEVEDLSDDIVELTGDLLRDAAVIGWIRSRVCFVEGTLVLAIDADGNRQLRPIETLREGDLVLAREEYGDRLSAREIVATSRRLTPGLLYVHFAGEDGAEGTISCTDEHPFWVANRNADQPLGVSPAESQVAAAEAEATVLTVEAATGSWIPAKHLQPGDQLTGPAGERLTITAIDDETLANWQPVYNLTVAQDATYFVAPADRWDAPLLVHNAGNCVAPRGERGPSGRVSTKKYLDKHWDRATFGTKSKSIDYHVGKHGKGLSQVKYTQKAVKAFKNTNAIKTQTIDMQGRPALKVDSPEGRGLFTPSGKIIWFHPNL